MDGCPATRFFIRHAEVLANDGNDPRLSEAGKARALALKEMLRNAAIGAIIVTRARRSGLTAEPLAGDLQIGPDVIDVDPGDTDANVAAVLAKLESLAEATPTLVVGHSNTLPKIIKELGGPENLVIDHPEFDRMFVQAGGGFTDLRYHP